MLYCMRSRDRGVLWAHLHLRMQHAGGMLSIDLIVDVENIRHISSPGAKAAKCHNVPSYSERNSICHIEFRSDLGGHRDFLFLNR